MMMKEATLLRVLARLAEGALASLFHHKSQLSADDAHFKAVATSLLELVKNRTAAKVTSATTSASTPTLTTREAEVLALIAKSMSNRLIATKLKISPRTAETHRANLMRKTGVHSQLALFNFALTHALPDPPT